MILPKSRPISSRKYQKCSGTTSRCPRTPLQKQLSTRKEEARGRAIPIKKIRLTPKNLTRRPPKSQPRSLSLPSNLQKSIGMSATGNFPIREIFLVKKRNSNGFGVKGSLNSLAISVQQDFGRTKNPWWFYNLIFFFIFLNQKSRSPHENTKTGAILVRRRVLRLRLLDFTRRGIWTDRGRYAVDLYKLRCPLWQKRADAVSWLLE